MTDVLQLTRVDPKTGLVERVPALARIEALLELPNAREVIRELDPQTIYGLIVEAGRDDAFELILAISGEQCQALVDFDCWRRDDFQLERLDEWLDLLLQRDDDEFEEMIDAMDPEPMVIWVRSRTQVLLWEDDRELIDTIDAPVMTSPDGVYAIVLAEDEDERFIGRLRLLMDRMWAMDLLRGQRLLEGARWELTTDMQERAYQYRNARLGDLGFVPVHEALEVYAVIKPDDWAAAALAVANDPNAAYTMISDAGMLPPVEDQLQELEIYGAAHSSFFHKAMARIRSVVEEKDVERVVDTLLTQLRSLVNRVHIADLGQPGDTQAGRRAIAAATDHLSMGLELVAGGDAELAARVLTRLPLLKSHQAGYSVAARLAWQARTMSDRGNLTLLDDVSESLLSPADRDLFEGLRQRRPVTSADSGERFHTLADVQTVSRRLAEIAFTELVLFGWLRQTRKELVERIVLSTRCATPAEDVTARVLLATLILRELAGLPSELEPLTLLQLHTAQRALAKSDDVVMTIVKTGQTLLEERNRLDPQTSPLAARVFADVAGWLTSEVSDWGRPLPEPIAASLVLLAASAD
jgi:hypothetical protein